MRKNTLLKLLLPRIFAAILYLCCLLGLAACGGQESAPQVEEEAVQTAPIESPAQDLPDDSEAANGAPDAEGNPVVAGPSFTTSFELSLLDFKFSFSSF